MRGRWQTTTGGSDWSDIVEAEGFDQDSTLQVNVGDLSHTGAWRSTEAHGGRLTIEGQTSSVQWSRDAEGIWITADGRTILFRAAGRQAGQGSEGALASPMPAKVLSVRVKVGDVVEEGDVLMVLEAMKMEHALKSPQAGTVTAINAAEGDQVAAGVPLADIE